MINRLTDITDVSDVNISHIGYDELSRRTALNFANNTSAAYTYDLVSRLLSLITNGPITKFQLPNPNQILPNADNLRSKYSGSRSDTEAVTTFGTISKSQTNTVNSKLPALRSQTQQVFGEVGSTVNSYSYTYDFEDPTKKVLTK